MLHSIEHLKAYGAFPLTFLDLYFFGAYKAYIERAYSHSPNHYILWSRVQLPFIQACNSSA